MNYLIELIQSSLYTISWSLLWIYYLPTLLRYARIPLRVMLSATTTEIIVVSTTSLATITFICITVHMISGEMPQPYCEVHATYSTIPLSDEFSDPTQTDVHISYYTDGFKEVLIDPPRGDVEKLLEDYKHGVDLQLANKGPVEGMAHRSVELRLDPIVTKKDINRRNMCLACIAILTLCFFGF